MGQFVLCFLMALSAAAMLMPMPQGPAVPSAVLQRFVK
jgi:hypothetical protein